MLTFILTDAFEEATRILRHSETSRRSNAKSVIWILSDLETAIGDLPSRDDQRLDLAVYGFGIGQNYHWDNFERMVSAPVHCNAMNYTDWNAKIAELADTSNLDSMYICVFIITLL